MIPAVRRLGNLAESIITMGDTREARRTAARHTRLTTPGAAYRPPPGVGEIKYVDTDLSPALCSDAPTVTCLNAIAQGVTANQRIGRKARIKSVCLKCSFLPDTVNTTAGTLRVALIWDKQNSAGIPTVGDILTGAAAGLSRGHLELAHSDRFQILADKFITVSANTAAGQARTLPSYLKYKKIGRTTVFSANAASYASINSGALWLLACGSHLAANCWTLMGTSRVRFTDS